MVPTKCASLVVSLLPALLAAPHPDDPVVFACLKSETFVMGGVLWSGKQAAAQIFENIGVKLLWSCPEQTGAETARDTILIRLAPPGAQALSEKERWLMRCPSRKKACESRYFTIASNLSSKTTWPLRAAFSDMSWPTRSRMFWKEWMRTPKRG